jgi:hypothetical protein
VLEVKEPRREPDDDGGPGETFLDEERGLYEGFMKGAAGGRSGISCTKSGKGGTGGMYWKLGLLPDHAGYEAMMGDRPKAELLALCAATAAADKELRLLPRISSDEDVFAEWVEGGREWWP